ncbi:hypothetical protein [Agaribacterium sp. ZY112]|uniref:hypothetical protein n=1 Tax=Agaribacterium sp. ZY112 TaxID=3233574 RepID=UPI00352333B8
MSTASISKTQLINTLKAWGNKEISTAELQDWMLDNYDPDEIKVGPGEPELVREAMNVVMNEYELAKPACILTEKYQLAIDFILCNEADFLNARTQFLRKAFTD